MKEEKLQEEVTLHQIIEGKFSPPGFDHYFSPSGKVFQSLVHGYILPSDSLQHILNS